MENLSQSQFGPFLIDVRERVLRRDGEPVPLTPKAFDVLAALVAQPGRLVSKQELLDRVWPDTFVEESNLTYNVFALRKALGDAADNGQYIETVPKRGYRFAAALTPVIARAGEQPLAGEEREGAEGPLPQIATAPARPRYQTMADLPSSRVPRRLFDVSRRWTVVATALLVAVTYFAVQSWRASSTGEPLRAIPLTSMTGVVRSPSLSPDGTHVVFTWTGERGGNPDLYVQQVGVDGYIQLTTDPGNDYSPSWSPDGRRIAFLRRGPDGGSSELRTIGPLGGPERKVADIQPGLASFRPTSLSWCPDSTCVVATDSSGDEKRDGLFVISLDTGEKRPLTNPPVTNPLDADPAISPDGRSLIFRRDSTPFSGEFYRLGLKDHLVPDGEPVRLTSRLSAGKPSWMPDSREFLFAARGSLWRLDAFRGSTPMRLPFVGQDGQAPVVSRTSDGRRRLVYVRSFADGNIWRVDTAAAGAPASSPPVSAIGSTRFDGIPNLSPAGQRVAFLSNRSGESEIWVSAPDGSNAVQVTSMAVLPGFPRWSPDGQSIVFHGDPRARPDVLVVPARGGRPTILTPEVLLNGGYPGFSRDGRWIYFAVVQESAPRVWKMPASGGAATQVTTNPGTIAIESHDGRDLYYVSGTSRPGSVWRQPLAGGPPSKVLDGVVLGNFDVVEGGIYYIDRVSGEAGVHLTEPSGETRLQYYEFATGRSTTVASNLGIVSFGMSASRDGRTVFFSRVDSSADELMLVENFR